MAITFQIGFRVDDKELKAGLASIQNDIQKAFIFHGSNGISKEIRDATNQAMVLEKALKRATTDKGVSYSQLEIELAKAGTSAGKLTATLAQGGAAFASSLNAANNALALSNRQVISLNRTLEEMRRVLIQSFKFTAAQTFLRAVSTEAREAVKWVTNLHDAVNEIGIVTGKTDGELKKVTAQAIYGSKELRVAAEDYAKGALIFYQQGLNDNEVIRRNEITIKAALAANQSIDEMSKQLTAIWNTYGMVGEEQLRAASVGAKMAAQTAVDFKDIAEAMQTAAAPAAQMGVEYNELAAIIATVGDVTQQSASTIGNAYKTIFSRFQQLRSEGTDGEVTLSSVSKQLKGLSIEVLDSAGNLRELGDVINEVGNNWGNWTKTQQTAIAQIVGGTRQYGQFLALMNNFDKYQKNLRSAQEEDGSTLEAQYTKALDSIESRAENAAEAWHRAFGKALDADQIKSFYSVLEGAGEAVGVLIKSLGGAPGILTLMATLLSGKIVPSIMSAGKSIATLWNSLTPQGRENSINKNFDEANTSITKSKSMTNDEKQIAINKNEFSRRTALLNEKINTSLETATGAYRTQLEMAKKILEVSQEQYQSSLDQEQAAAKKVGSEEKALRILQSQLELNAQLAEAEYNQALERHQSATENVQSAQIDKQIADEKVIQAQLGVYAQEDNLQAAQQLGDPNLIAEATQDLRYARQELAKATTEASEAQQKLNDAMSEEQSSENEINETRKSAELAQKAAAIGKVTQQYNKMAQAIAKYDASDRTEDDFQEATKVIDDMLESMKQVPNLTEAAQKELEDLGNKLAESNQETSLDEILADIVAIREALSEDFEIDVEVSDNILNAHGDVEQAVRRQRQARQESERHPDQEDELPAIDVGGYISGLVQIGAAATAATTAVGNLIDVWNDGNSTTEEKLVALVAIIPQIGVALSTLQAGIVVLGKSMHIAGAEAEGFGIKAFLAGLKAQAGLAPFLPILYAVAAAVAVVAVALTAWKIGIEQMQQARQNEVDQLTEELDKTRELTDAIEENTKAAKDNVDAYFALAAAGEDASEAYDKMVDSLKSLNRSLEETGASSEELEQAMTRALATGNMDRYYDIARQKSRELYEQEMQQSADLAQAQVKLSEANMTEWLDFDGPKKTQVATTTSYEGDVVVQPSAALSKLVEDSDLLSKNGGTITLNLDFDNAADFRTQYKELVKLRKELEKTGGTASEIAVLDKQIKGMTENFNALEETVVAARESMEGMTLESIKYQIDPESGGMDLEDMDLSQQSAYMNSIYESMRAYGEAIGLQGEEIESSFRSVIASIPELNTALASMDQVSQITENALASENGGWGAKEQAENIERITQETQNLQQVLQDGAKKTGIGEWFNGLSAEEEYIKNTLGKTKEEVIAEIEALKQEATNAAVDVQTQVAETFNGLSLEDRKLLLETGIDFVDDPEDIQQILDNIKDLKLRVSIEIKNEGELRAEIESDNSLQKNMEPAIKEYKDTGMVSVDTAREMIDAGLAEYLMVVNDHFVLTTGAAEGYNSSLEREKDNTQALLGLMTELRAPAMGFAETVAVLNATMDNPVLENYTKQLEDVSVGFLNSEGSAEDLITYFNGMETAINGSLDAISQNINDFTTNQMHQFLQSFEAIGTNLADTMAKADTAVAKGEMTIGQYREALTAAGQVQRQASSAALEASQSRLSDSIAKVNKQLGLSGDAYIGNISDLKTYIAQQKAAQKAEGKSTDSLDNLTDSLNDAQQEYDGIESSIKDFDESFSDLNALQGFTDTVTNNFESLQGILNDDFSLRINMEDLDFSQYETLKGTVQSALDSIAGLSEEAMGRVADALIESQDNLETFVVNGTTYTKDGLIAALRNHEISAEAIMKQGGAAAEAILKATATENEQAIKTAGQAIGGLMSAVGQLVKNFQADITVTVEEADLKLTPSWKGALDLGAKLLAGETVSIQPSGTIKFGISGGLSGDSGEAFKSALDNASNFFNTSDSGGLSDGSPSLSNYNTQTPTMADPAKFDTPEGTEKSNKNGGGSKKTEKPKEHDPKEAENYEKMEDRYATLKAAIDDVGRALEDFSNAEDDAFGAAKFAAMKKQEQSLTKQAKLYQALRQKALEYLKMDQEAVKNGKNKTDLKAELVNRGLGGDLIEATFDDDGFVANRTEIINELNTKLESAYQDYKIAADNFDRTRSTNEAESERIDGLKKRYEDLKALVEAYLGDLDLVDETAGEARQALLDELEKLREWMQKKVDQANYKLELRIGINEMDIKMMEMTIRLWDKLGVKMGSTFKNLNSNFISSADNLSGMIDNSKRMWEILDNISPDSEHQEWFVGQFGEDAWKEYLDGNGALPDSVVQNLEDKADMMMDELSNMYDIAEEMLGQFVEAMNMFIEDFDKIADKLSRQNEKLDMFEELLDFSGKKYSDEGREAMMGILQARMDNAKVAVANAKAEQEFTKVAVDEAKASLEQFYAQKGRDVSAYDDTAASFYNQLKNSLDEAEAAAAEAESKFYSSMQELTAAARAAIEESARIIEEELVDSLGGIFDSFDSGLDMYQHQEDIGNFFLDDYDKGYELKKLLGEIEDAMEDVSDPERLSEWGTLIDDINAANEDGVKITQTDLDILKARFDLQKAYDEYSDARAGKNTMRLQRDASGNYSYVYSNDGSSASDDSQQKVEDALHNIHKMHQEAADEMSSMWFQTYVEMQQYMSNVDQLRLENDAEYAAEVQWYKDMYQQKLEHYRDQTIQHNTAIDRSYDETTLGIITGMKDMESTHDWYMQQAVLYDEKLKESALSWEEQVRNTCNENGVNYDNLEHTVQEDTGLMIEENEALRKKIEELKTDGTRSLQLLGGEIRSFTLNGINQLGEMKRAVEELIGKLQELKNAQLSKIEDMEATEGYYDRNTDYTSLFGNLYSDYKANAGESAMSPEEYLKKNPWIVDQVYAAMMNDDRRGEHYKGDDPNFSRDDAYQHLINGWQGFRPGDWNFGTEGSNIEIDIDKVVVNGDKHNIMPTSSGGLIKTPQVRSLAEEGPELVLNAEDTENILRAVKYMRETVQAQMGIAWDKQYAAIQEKISHASSTRYNHDEEYKAYLDAALAGQEQKVQIEAHFPGVTAASEIEEAFNQLITQAAQYRIRQDR